MEACKIESLQITKHLAHLGMGDTLTRLLLSQTQCTVRLYVLNAFNLASRDLDSPSDPYLKVTLGNKEFSDRDNYQNDEPNPEFNKCFEFSAVFPGCAPLKIEVMDYDLLFGDDQIGQRWSTSRTDSSRPIGSQFATSPSKNETSLTRPPRCPKELYECGLRSCLQVSKRRFGTSNPERR